MEDCHDLGWQAAKGAHAVVLCQMEENKVSSEEINKLDHIRCVHAQRNQNYQGSPTGRSKSKEKGTPCRFYQKGTCGQKNEHETGGRLYLHACEFCFSKVKKQSSTL